MKLDIACRSLIESVCLQTALKKRHKISHLGTGNLIEKSYFRLQFPPRFCSKCLKDIFYNNKWLSKLKNEELERNLDNIPEEQCEDCKKIQKEIPITVSLSKYPDNPLTTEQFLNLFILFN